PGQPWLWLYTFWYQVPFAPYNGPNADNAVWATMAILTLALIFVPYIPGLNRLPEFLGVHRLIWREHYKEVRSLAQQQSASVPEASRGRPGNGDASAPRGREGNVPRAKGPPE
ncbi:MAG: hypothetical protein M3069_18280, partial [Chloroflexota bacterium]|nr:hypothetical protein [Chloroflexota bacterium]